MERSSIQGPDLDSIILALIQVLAEMLTPAGRVDALLALSRRVDVDIVREEGGDERR